MVSLGVRGSTIPTTLLEFRCAPVGTGTALVRKPARIYWVEVKTLTLGSNLSIGPSTKLFNNHEAIAIQNQQRLDHFITASLPKLYGISNLLQDFRPSVVNNEFSSLVTTLSQQLASIALGSDPDPPSSATLALPIHHLGVAQASNTS